eukprot:464708_1
MSSRSIGWCEAGCPKRSEEELDAANSVHFNAKAHYDHNIYLNDRTDGERMQWMQLAFQADIRRLSEQICDENNGAISVRYRAGAVKILRRSQIKLKKEHSNAPYPSSEQLLDINRCQLQFEEISSMMRLICDHFGGKNQNETDTL